MCAALVQLDDTTAAEVPESFCLRVQTFVLVRVQGDLEDTVLPDGRAAFVLHDTRHVQRAGGRTGAEDPLDGPVAVDGLAGRRGEGIGLQGHDLGGVLLLGLVELLEESVGGVEAVVDRGAGGRVHQLVQT